MNRARVVAGLRRRLDDQALDQLRAVAAAQAEQIDSLQAENASLRGQLDQAESWCDAWRDDALRFQQQLCEHTGGEPGMTADGALVVVPAEQVAA